MEGSQLDPCEENLLMFNRKMKPITAVIGTAFAASLVVASLALAV